MVKKVVSEFGLPNTENGAYSALFSHIYSKIFRLTAKFFTILTSHTAVDDVRFPLSDVT